MEGGEVRGLPFPLVWLSEDKDYQQLFAVKTGPGREINAQFSSGESEFEVKPKRQYHVLGQVLTICFYNPVWTQALFSPVRSWDTDYNDKKKMYK